MVELIQIILIAIVQGIGEFLPISSSGHLLVTAGLCEHFGKALTENGNDQIKLVIALHFGTLVAVLIVFRRRILDLFGRDMRLIPLLIIGTVPAVLVGVGIVKSAPWIATDLYVVGGCFILTGLLLLISMQKMDGDRDCSSLTWSDALFIGVFQALAILPGLSRSGSTIVAGLFRNMKRDEAATFSFLLSIPIILISCVYQIKELLTEKQGESTLSLTLLAVGVLFSCGVGILALTWLMDWLKKGKLWYFALWVFLMSPLAFWLAANTLPKADIIKIKTEAKIKSPPVSQAGNERSRNKEQSQTSPDKNNETAVDATESGRDSLSRAIEETTSSPLDMTREEALKEYEKILAEEEAKELALIEEEQKRLPLVDDPDKLIPLDPKDRIWIMPDGKSVILLGRVALREGLLELLACRISTKEHESIISVRIKPFLIHAALLAVGAEPGKPVQVYPEFVAPTGEEIEIRVRWQDEDGKIQEALAQDWVLDHSKSTKTEKKAMQSNWVFTGSLAYKDDDGVNHYVADESGEIVGLSNFVGAILDVPFESSAENADLLFSCFTERIPELHTPLTIVLTPVKNKR